MPKPKEPAIPDEDSGLPAPPPPPARAPAPHWSTWIGIAISVLALAVSLWFGANNTALTFDAAMDRKLAAEREEWHRDNDKLQQTFERELAAEHDKRIDRENQLEILVCEQILHRSLDYGTGNCKPAPQP